jgi:hypothetical protein
MKYPTCAGNYLLYQKKMMTYSQTKPQYRILVWLVAKILIGVLLLAKQRHIVNFIERKRKNNAS